MNAWTNQASKADYNAFLVDATLVCSLLSSKKNFTMMNPVEKFGPLIFYDSMNDRMTLSKRLLFSEEHSLSKQEFLLSPYTHLLTSNGV